MKRKPETETALDHYRRIVRPAPAQRERALRELERRIALAERPALLDQAPASLPRARWLRPWQVRLGVGGAGVIALLVAVLQRPSGAPGEPRPRSPAVPPAVVVAPASPPSAAMPMSVGVAPAVELQSPRPRAKKPRSRTRSLVSRRSIG